MERGVGKVALEVDGGVPIPVLQQGAETELDHRVLKQDTRHGRILRLNGFDPVEQQWRMRTLKRCRLSTNYEESETAIMLFTRNTTSEGMHKSESVHSSDTE